MTAVEDRPLASSSAPPAEPEIDLTQFGRRRWGQEITPPTVTVGQSRRAAWGLLLLLVVLPLQWQALAVTPAGAIRYFQVASILMVIIARPPWASIRIVARELAPLVPGAIVFVVVGAGVAFGWQAGGVDYLQTGLYFVFGLVAGGCVWTALQHEPGHRILRWSSPLALVVFLGSFSQALSAANISPVATFSEAFAQGNPQLLEFGLYRAAFATTSEEASTSLRHEIFASLIVILGITLMMQARTSIERALLVGSSVLTVALVLVSQSRSVTLALGIAGLFIVIRSVLRNRIPLWLFVVFMGVVAAAPVFIPKIAPIFLARFADSGSYEGRLGALDLTAGEAVPRFFFGGPPLPVSTHNTVGDAFLRGGLICGIGAIAVVLAYFRAGIRSVIRYYQDNSLPAYAGVLIMSVVITRSFTAGSGQLHQNEWVGLGAVGAMLALYRSGVFIHRAPRRKKLKGVEAILGRQDDSLRGEIR